MEVAWDEEELFILDCLRLNRAGVEQALEKHPEYRQSPRALFRAVQDDRVEVVKMLLDLGFSVEQQDAAGQRPLHVAAAHNALWTAQLLIERAAEIDSVEPNWNGTPLGFAIYHEFPEMVDLLSRYSRSIPRLAFAGKVERLGKYWKQSGRAQ